MLKLLICWTNKNFHDFRRKKPLPLWHCPIRNWLTSAAPSPGPNWKVWLPISNLKSSRGTFVSSVQKPNSTYFSLGVTIVNFANKMCAPNAFQRWVCLFDFFLICGIIFGISFLEFVQSRIVFFSSWNSNLLMKEYIFFS